MSGFDDIDAIMEMDIQDGPKNSITVIESYIEKRKLELEKCMGPNQSLSLPFEFPPGHRIRISKFVDKIQHQYGHHKKSVPKTAKRRKLDSLEVQDRDDRNDHDDIPTVTNEIRRKVTNWAKTSYKGDLKENEHYKIHVTYNISDSTRCSASIRCGCGKAFLLQRKPTGSRPWLISNWTKHYKQCKYGKGQSGKQETLQSFFPSTSEGKKVKSIPAIASHSPQSFTEVSPQHSYAFSDTTSLSHMPQLSYPTIRFPEMASHFISPFAKMPQLSHPIIPFSHGPEMASHFFPPFAKMPPLPSDPTGQWPPQPSDEIIPNPSDVMLLHSDPTCQSPTLPSDQMIHKS